MKLTTMNNKTKDGSTSSCNINNDNKNCIKGNINEGNLSRYRKLENQ